MDPSHHVLAYEEEHDDQLLCPRTHEDHMSSHWWSLDTWQSWQHHSHHWHEILPGKQLLKGANCERRMQWTVPPQDLQSSACRPRSHPCLIRVVLSIYQCVSQEDYSVNNRNYSKSRIRLIIQGCTNVMKAGSNKIKIKNKTIDNPSSNKSVFHTYPCF